MSLMDSQKAALAVVEQLYSMLYFVTFSLSRSGHPLSCSKAVCERNLIAHVHTKYIHYHTAVTVIFP